MKKRERYYSPKEVKELLEANPDFKQYLYSKGYLITDRYDLNLTDYPFYGLWDEMHLTDGFNLFVRKNVSVFTYNNSNVLMFLIGHAYDPYSMVADENVILENLSAALERSEEHLWKKISDVSGIFVFGFIKDGRITISPDCCGMRIDYYGIVNGHFYATSHSKLVADIENLHQDPYVTKIVNKRYWHYFGRWLPGDLSPYIELKRLCPNHKLVSDHKEIYVTRYYPTKKIVECVNDGECEDVIKELAYVMSNNMKLIAQKWPNNTAAIAVTGGRDSTTALACANGVYDQYKFFSYISNKPEEVDAIAAHKICQNLGLEHEIFEIPNSDDKISGVDLFQIIIQCNQGCIGKINANDARKRLWFCRNPQFEIEIKSWVNELGRGSQYIKYNTDRFPRKPYPSYLRCLHKIYLDPVIIHETNKVFKKYQNQYLSDDVISIFPWMELLWWEFSWSGLEGLALTSEQLVSYDMTIPFNNRRYVETMLKIPVNKRMRNYTPEGIIKITDKRIADSGVIIKDLEHTDKLANAMRIYLKVFSKLVF